MLLRPGNPEFVALPGRHELLISNQPCDFAMEGPFTDPAHCVEGSATMRGPGLLRMSQ